MATFRATDRPDGLDLELDRFGQLRFADGKLTVMSGGTTDGADLSSGTGGQGVRGRVGLGRFSQRNRTRCRDRGGSMSAAQMWRETTYVINITGPINPTTILAINLESGSSLTLAGTQWQWAACGADSGRRRQPARPIRLRRKCHARELDVEHVRGGRQGRRWQRWRGRLGGGRLSLAGGNVTLNNVSSCQRQRDRRRWRRP